MDVHVDVLRVFCRDDGEGGNALGVVLDGSTVAEDDRQGLARYLAYAETVFVDDPVSGAVRIFTPEVELPFAGHPCVGTGWLLAREGHPADRLETPAGTVGLRHPDDGTAWANARAEWSPPFELIEHSSPAEVDALALPEAGWRYEWAWIDEAQGAIRARSFVPEAGVPEDEATGSAAVRLCARLDRPITIHQGRASVIRARPIGGGRIEFGGRVIHD